MAESTQDAEWLAGQVETYAATSLPPLHSVLILQRDRVILERYWHGFAADSYQRVNSITKSVVSALAGLALLDGRLSLSNTLADLFPEFHIRAPLHAARVTVRDLLTMTAGFDRRVARGGYLRAPDPIPLLLARKGAAPPGQQFFYLNGDADLLAVAVERAVGEPLIDYAQRRLFAPLGIWTDMPRFLWLQKGAGKHSFSPGHQWDPEGRLWKVDRQGHAKGAYCLHLRTRDLARLGQLYAQGGLWEQTELLPAAFVADSTRNQVPGGHPEGTAYGYLWWTTQTDGERPAFFAAGLGGQYIYVVPHLALVVVTTSSSSGSGQQHRKTLSRLATEEVTGGARYARPGPSSM